MSRSVDIACLRCGVEFGLDINHGDDECFALLELAPELAAIGRKAEQKNLWRFFDAGPILRIAAFIAEHTGEGHDLAVRDEYGDVNRGCGESAGDYQTGERPPDVNGFICRLRKGHAGPHSRIEETKP